MGSTSARDAELGSNNPFRQATTNEATDQTRRGQPQPLETGMQMACAETLSNSENAPTPVQPTPSASLLAEREADKETTDSWQAQSRGQSAPISMVYHETNSPSSLRGDAMFSDVKGPPPAYDDSSHQTSSPSGSSLMTPTSIHPESPGEDLPPRPEDKSAVGQLLSWIPPVPSNAHQPPRLCQPVVVPQLDVPPHGESVPFQRCYSDALAACRVPMQEFTRFLDGLEIAQLPSSTLQGLRMFGVGVQHVPVPILATLTGKGISALGSSGSGHSGSRARLYLDQARERYFQPRGLRVSIVKDDDLNARLQVSSHMPRLGALTSSAVSASCVARRLESLIPYTTPLRYDVPDQDRQMQGVQKMARKHLRSRFKEHARRIEPLRQRQRAGDVVAAAVSGRDPTASAWEWEERYWRKREEVRIAQDALVRAGLGVEEKGGAAREQLRMKQHELELVVLERQNAARGDDAVAAEMEEARWAGRLKWLVVESL